MHVSSRTYWYASVDRPTVSPSRGQPLSQISATFLRLQVVVVSKTFTTAETMLNARTLKKWLLDGVKVGGVLWLLIDHPGV